MSAHCQTRSRIVSLIAISSRPLGLCAPRQCIGGSSLIMAVCLCHNFRCAPLSLSHQTTWCPFSALWLWTVNCSWPARSAPIQRRRVALRLHHSVRLLLGVIHSLVCVCRCVDLLHLSPGEGDSRQIPYCHSLINANRRALRATDDYLRAKSCVMSVNRATHRTSPLVTCRLSSGEQHSGDNCNVSTEFFSPQEWQHHPPTNEESPQSLPTVAQQQAFYLARPCHPRIRT